MTITKSIASSTIDPLQKSMIYTPVEDVGGDKTIIANTRAFTLTGINNILTRNVPITASTGSFTLTGIDATLTPPEQTEGMYFDGAATYVHVDNMRADDTLQAGDYLGACTIEAEIYVVSTASTQILWSLGTVAYRFGIVSGNWYINGTGTGVAASTGKHDIKITFDASGNATQLHVDNVSVWSGSISAVTDGWGSKFYIGCRPATADGTPGLFFEGGISNFRLSGSSVENFAFYGYADADLNWADQSSDGNDGTVNNADGVINTTTGTIT